MKYARIVEAVMSRPWAILPRYLVTITDLLRYRAEGGRLTQDEITSRLEAAGPRTTPGGGGGAQGVAVINIIGVIAPRSSMFDDVSTGGGASVEAVSQALRQVMADDQVSGVVLNIDSPGGMVDGIPELAAEIRAARGTKPIVAVANTYAASAAYWLASQADELAVSPSGEIGSIGVFAAHDDLSALYEAEGVKTTLISAGRYKVEQSDLGPLSDDAKAYLQAQVDAYHTMFVRDVAAGRHTTSAAVRSDFGQGRMVMAADAVKAGMADRVATLDQMVALVARQAARPGRATALGGVIDMVALDDARGPSIYGQLDDPGVWDAIAGTEPVVAAEPVAPPVDLELARIRARAHARDHAPELD